MGVNKIKILFIITQAELGGAQRWVFDTATHLDKNHYQVAVAAGGNGPLLENLYKAGARVITLKNLTRNINPVKDIFSILEIYRLIKRERPDVLQLCSTKAGFNGSIAGKMAGVSKIIYRIGGWSFNDPRPTWQNTIFLWLEKISAPLKDKIIINSQKDFNQALQLKICPKEKLFLLYNGIELGAMTYHSSDRKQKNGPLAVGIIANFYPTKGLRYLIEAINILKNKNCEPRTIIIGDGPERSLLESLIKKYQLENTVILIGQKENPWSYLEGENAGIFVIPSVKEGVPYALLEAMDRGMPIIATAVGGIPEIIKDREGGLLISPKDSGALAAAIQDLTNDSDLRSRLALHAQQVMKNFDLQKMLIKFEEVLSS